MGERKSAIICVISVKYQNIANYSLETAKHKKKRISFRKPAFIFSCQFATTTDRVHQPVTIRFYVFATFPHNAQLVLDELR